MKGTRYRLGIVVTELDASNISIEYQVALLSFVNCLINATQGLRDRMRIRNEFIGKFFDWYIFILYGDFDDEQWTKQKQIVIH